MKMLMREDGRIEWTCKHGVGHTIAIPYHLVKLAINHESKTTRQDEMNVHFSHGCCGCCGEGRKE